MTLPETPRSGGGDWSGRNIWVLTLLTAIYAINVVDRNLLGLLMPQVKSDLGLSDAMLGLLAGFAFAAFHALAALPIGSIADRWNRRNIIAIGLTFWSLMMMVHAFVRTGWEFAIARFLLGAGEATSVAPSNSIIADLFGPAQRPMALGFLSAAASLGIMIGFPILGGVSEAHGWRAAFIAAGVPGIGLALVLFLTVREPKRAAPVLTSMATALPLAEALKRLLGQRRYVFVVAAGAVSAITMGVMTTWLPSFVSRVHGLDQSEIGHAIGFLRGAGGLVGAILGGWATTTLGRRDTRWLYRVPALCMILVAPAELLILFGPGSAWRAGVALEMMLVMAQFGPVFALIVTASDSRTRSVAIAGFLVATNIVGQGGGPWIAGLVSDALQPSLGVEALRYALLTSVGAALVAGILCLEAGRKVVPGRGWIKWSTVAAEPGTDPGGP